MDILKGKDSEWGIDITYHPKMKHLWLRFACFYLTIVFNRKGQKGAENE